MKLLSVYPPQPRISNFQKEYFTFNEPTNGFTPPSTSGLRTPLLVINYIYIYTYIYICPVGVTSLYRVLNYRAINK